jgi:hypothetical protein
MHPGGGRKPTEVEGETPRRSIRRQGEGCNMRSTFETSRRNNCNIHQKIDATFEICVTKKMKHLKYVFETVAKTTKNT